MAVALLYAAGLAPLQAPWSVAGRAVNLPRWSLRNPVTAGMVLVSVLVVGAISGPRLPLAFLPDVSFPALEITHPVSQRAAGAGRGGDHAPGRGGARHAEPGAPHQLVVVGQRRQHQRRSSTGARTSRRCASRRARSSSASATSCRSDVDLIQVNSFRSSDIPVLECRIAADHDLSRDYELLNRHVADPAAARAGRRQGRALRRRAAAGADRLLVSPRSQRHGLDAEQRAAPPRRLEPQPSAPAMLRRGDEAWPLRVREPVRRASRSSQNFPVNDRGPAARGRRAPWRCAEPDLDYGRHLDRGAGDRPQRRSRSRAPTRSAVARRARAGARGHRRDPAARAASRCSRSPTRRRRSANSLEGLLHAGMIGAVLATVVLLLFLRNSSPPLVGGGARSRSRCWPPRRCSTSPAASLNILSMMGLMLAVGMLVDNAVVVLESIHRHREQRRSRPARRAGRQPRGAAGGDVRRPRPRSSCSCRWCSAAAPRSRPGSARWGAPSSSRWSARCSCRSPRSRSRWGACCRRAVGPPVAGCWRASSAFHQACWAGRSRTARRTAGHRARCVFVHRDRGASCRSTRARSPRSRWRRCAMEYEFADNVNYREVEKLRHARSSTWMQARKDSLHVKSTYSVLHQQRRVARARYLATGYAARRGRRSAAQAAARRPARAAGREAQAATATTSDSRPLAASRCGCSATRAAARPARRGGAAARWRACRAWPTCWSGASAGGRRSRWWWTATARAATGSRPHAVGGAVAQFFRGRPLARFRGPDGEVQVQARLAERDRSEPRARLDELADRRRRAGPAGPARLGGRRSAPCARRPASSASSGARSSRCAATAIPRRRARSARRVANAR